MGGGVKKMKSQLEFGRGGLHILSDACNYLIRC